MMKTITLNVIGMVELVVITILMVGIVFAMLVNALTLLVDLELVKISGKTKKCERKKAKGKCDKKKVAANCKKTCDKC